MKMHILLCFILSIALCVPPIRIKPEQIKPYMFTDEISGTFDVLSPTTRLYSQQGKLMTESYTIFMERIKTQMLPKNFPQTTIFAYGGKCENDKMVISYPGPAIIAKTNVPVRVTWTNNIFGAHLFPVDISHPFNSSNVFKYEIPLVPHVHGLASPLHSDGQPNAYWTALGSKGGKYKTQQPVKDNQAVFVYPNQQTPGLFWYHDHTMGLTRLNVYAGLAGFYEIIDPKINQEQKVIQKNYGDLERKALVIADKIFQKSGQLFYHFESPNKDFTSWVPQFYGDVMVVNGKVWPKMVLKPTKYRFVLLNGCQSRFLNIFFLNNNKKIPFDLIRTEGDYFKNPVTVTSFFLQLSARLEIVIDFSNITGDVMIKNNAQAPHPDGDPANLVDQFTGTIMKLVINSKGQTQPEPNVVIQSTQHLTRSNIQTKSLNQIEIQQQAIPAQLDQKVKTQIVLQNSTYPAFPEGEKVTSVLIEIQSQQQQVAAMFIDGISYENSMKCQGRKFKVGQTYDFYIVNLTPDSHPIHMHLIQFQKVMQIPFDVERYKQDWQELNGGSPGAKGYENQPKQLDPSTYYIGQKQYPKQSQKTFRDVINIAADYVTVIRVKYSHNDGSNFSFDVSGNAYVWHCHMLQHQDNDMMKFFCFE